MSCLRVLTDFLKMSYMNYRKKNQINQNDNMDKAKNRFSLWASFISISFPVLGLAYYAGRWTAQRENKEEIIILNQKHNREITDLKIEFNYQIIELKNQNRELLDNLNTKTKKGDNNE